MRSQSSGARRAVLAALAATAFSGCFADPTEVVVVMDTDAKAPTDFAQIQFTFSTGGVTFPNGRTSSNMIAFASADGSSLPVTIGVIPAGESEFDVLVTLATNPSFFGDPANAPLPFETRKVSNVRFVTNEMRTLFIPIPKICACVTAAGAPSTNCPHALDPECSDITSPKLTDFDEDNLPRLAASTK
jgi:hypothetical protein